MFIDLASAFDSVDRSHLWAKLVDMNIDKQLLFLLCELHSGISTQNRDRTSDLLTERIDIGKGVKHGYVLTPSLFNLYIIM